MRVRLAPAVFKRAERRQAHPGAFGQHLLAHAGAHAQPLQLAANRRRVGLAGWQRVDSARRDRGPAVVAPRLGRAHAPQCSSVGQRSRAVSRAALVPKTRRNERYGQNE